MGLKEDVLRDIGEILGSKSAESVVSAFDDPKKYPEDFLEEYTSFLVKLIGEGAAKRKIEPLYTKYVLHCKPIRA